MRRFIRSSIRGLSLRKISFLLTLLALLLASVSLVSAQTGGDFDLSWFTVDGGGGTVNGGGYKLSGFIGQPDTGSLSGGGYTLRGGFFQDGGQSIAPPSDQTIYLPLILK